MFPFFFDYTMFLLLPAFVFATWAQHRVKSTFAYYSRINSREGITAADVARMLLDRFGLNTIPVKRVSGELTDHYDPRNKSLSLSDSVYNSSSIAAIGVAAHEVGHAIQDSEGYAPLALRNTVVPVVSFSSSLSFPLFFLGLIIHNEFWMNLGIVLFLGVIIFHMVTLPVEFNASSQAIAILKETGALNVDELEGANKVLNAAALTYIAATLMAVMQLVRLLMLRNSRR